MKLLVLIISLLLIVGCAEVAEKEESTDKMEDFVDSGEFQTTADGTKYLVNPKDIRGGGPPKDGIPAIDHPRFVTVEEANEWIQDDELVLAIDYDRI